jgi:hypothetical protein
MALQNNQPPHTGALGSPVPDRSDASRSVPLSGDILYGAEKITIFVFGDRRHRRRVYNFVERAALPTFRIGMNICARQSVLLEWIAGQERIRSDAGA